MNSDQVPPRFAESWLHGWSDGVPVWRMFRREEPEQNLSWRKEINRVALLSLTYVPPVGRHTPGLGDALGLKCIVCAAVVQVMTETADHQGQYLGVWQHVLETGRLAQGKWKCTFIICRNFLFLGTDQIIADRMRPGGTRHGFIRGWSLNLL